MAKLHGGEVAGPGRAPKRDDLGRVPFPGKDPGHTTSIVRFPTARICWVLRSLSSEVRYLRLTAPHAWPRSVREWRPGRATSDPWSFWANLYLLY